MNFLRRTSWFSKKQDKSLPAIAAQTAKRILDFSDSKCQLREENRQLVVIKENDDVVKIPFAEIAVVLISHSSVTVSQSVLESLAEFGAMLTICNYKYMPVSMMMPFEHSSILERLRLQIDASQPTMKNAWQQIIKRKIQMQSNVLLQFFDDDDGLSNMIDRVKSGDPDNVEAQAAKKYWAALFPELDFHRNPDGDDPLNARLNYGYTVLRSITARAVCASGFHPALGIHHCSQRNAFCLADDLMEPFRPLVDCTVRHQYQLSKKLASQKLTRNLTAKVKQQLIFPLTGRFKADGESRKLFDIIALLAQSLVKFYAKETETLYLPALERENPQTE